MTTQTDSPRREIEALASVASKDQTIHNLREILSSYGNVLSIEQLPPTTEDNTYLVDFEKIEDAISASVDLKYCLFGYSTLVISLPQIGNIASQASPG
jgi:hypothetical protein